MDRHTVQAGINALRDKGITGRPGSIDRAS
jgi:hypothetical protein